MSKAVVTVGVVILMLLAPMAGVAGAASQPVGEEETEPDLSVSASAPYHLEADYDSADTVVDNQDIRLGIADTDGNSLNWDQMGAFGEDVPFSYNDDIIDSEESTLVVGQVDPDGEFTEEMLVDAISGGEDTVDILNENVNFHVAKSSDDEDYLQYGDEEVKSGPSVALLVDGGVEVEGEEGDIVPTSDGEEIVGIEPFVVHNSISDVDAPSASIDPGQSADFEIETDLSDEVHHSVVVYDGETFSDQETMIEVSDPIEGPSDTAVSTTLSGVNGNATIEDEINLIGHSVEPANAAGTFTLDHIVELAADELDFEEESIESEDGATLDASVTGVVGDSDESISVETLDNWEEGDYQWVHVASGGDGLETNAGTVTLEEDDSGSGGGGGGGGAAPPSDDDDDDDVTDDDEHVDDDVKTDDDDEHVTDDDDDPAVTDDDDDVTDDADDVTEEDDSIPGFGVAAAIVALLAMMVFTTRTIE